MVLPAAILRVRWRHSTITPRRLASSARSYGETLEERRRTSHVEAPLGWLSVDWDLLSHRSAVDWQHGPYKRQPRILWTPPNEVELVLRCR
jgi:hypothetical protein